MRNRTVVSLFVASAVAVTATVADAQPVVAPPGLVAPTAPPPATGPGRSYLGQLIAADTASMALMVGGAMIAEDTSIVPVLAGGVGVMIAGPLIHRANGNGDVATTSLALHLLAPAGGALIGGIVGVAVAGDQRGFDALGTMLIAIGIGECAGLIGARVYDYGHAHAPVRARAVESAPGIALAPSVTARADGATFGVVGSY